MNSRSGGLPVPYDHPNDEKMALLLAEPNFVTVIFGFKSKASAL